MVLSIIIAVLIIAIDQISKHIVDANMALGESIELIKNVFSITYVRNEGAAYGIFANNKWIFMVISIIIIGIVIFAFIKYKEFGLMFQIPLALIFGGAVGNMIDRIFLGYVIDFLEPTFLPFAKFTNNIADICINVGAIFLAIYFIFINKVLWKDDKKKEKSDENTESTKQAW